MFLTLLAIIVAGTIILLILLATMVAGTTIILMLLVTIVARTIILLMLLATMVAGTTILLTLPAIILTLHKGQRSGMIELVIVLRPRQKTVQIRRTIIIRRQAAEILGFLRAALTLR
jgi:hypothetical protein